jgi:hypothetical protein
MRPFGSPRQRLQRLGLDPKAIGDHSDENADYHGRRCSVVARDRSRGRLILHACGKPWLVVTRNALPASEESSSVAPAVKRVQRPRRGGSRYGQRHRRRFQAKPTIVSRRRPLARRRPHRGQACAGRTNRCSSLPSHPQRRPSRSPHAYSADVHANSHAESTPRRQARVAP